MLDHVIPTAVKINAYLEAATAVGDVLAACWARVQTPKRVVPHQHFAGHNDLIAHSQYDLASVQPTMSNDMQPGSGCVKGDTTLAGQMPQLFKLLVVQAFPAN